MQHSELKANLTPDEKLRAAHAHIVQGVDQHIIASLFGVNPGRVNEAIKAIRAACGFTKGVKNEKY
jgi:transposase-like protein